MKNIFQYATKELSQDAFLMWLFENHDCENENVRKTAYKLLNTFCELDMHLGDIAELKCYKQYKDIDIIVRFEYCGNKYLLAIEDKTFSGQHDDQLAKYNRVLKKENKETLDYMSIDDKAVIKKIFYKTDIDYYKDEEVCEKDGWTCYFIEDIKKIFYGIKNTQSQILDDYVEHLEWVYENVMRVSKKPIKDWDKTNYRTFLNIEIMPFTKNLPKSEWDIKLSGWHSYSSLVLDHWIKYNDKKYVLGMEIRSKTDGLGVIIRFIDKTSGKDVEVDGLTKTKIRSIVNSSSFNTCNYKWCIANSSKSLDERLSAKNNTDVLTNNLKDLINEYISICNECDKMK